MTAAVTVISSMATRNLLAELADSYAKDTGQAVSVLSIGGIEAARRIRAGERFDMVVLAKDALLPLAADGLVSAATMFDFVRSPTGIAVRAGAPRPASCGEAEIWDLIGAARAIGISTGPSGGNVRTLLQSRRPAPSAQVVVAPSGVPVARLIAAGEVDIGFQQRSELVGEPGIDVLGAVPETLLPTTIFAAALTGAFPDGSAARAFASYLRSPATGPVKQRHGMLPPG